MKSVGFALVAVLGLFSVSGDAFAFTSLSSPYGTSAVSVLIGNRNGVPSVAWSRNSDHACTITVIGNSSGLFDDYQVNGDASADDIRIEPGVTDCGGVSQTALVYGAHYLDIAGQGGADILMNFSAGDTWIYGADGNDTLVNFNPAGEMTGDAGNDQLYSLSSGTAETLYGGDGNDCLSDSNASAVTFDCGAGTDKKLNSSYPATAVNCELTGPSCP